MRANDDIRNLYSGRTIVVTGAYGYLGSGLSALLSGYGATVRRVTRESKGSSADDSWVGDLGKADFCASLVDGADAVVHLAGQTSIRASFENPVGDLRANVESTLNLLHACAGAKPKLAFIYGGTATEIGLTLDAASSLSEIDRPTTVYDANKLAAETLVAVYSSSGVVAGTTIRIANVYGPGAKKSAADRGVLNRMIARAMTGQPLTYFGDGGLLRDYVYVDDLLDAFIRTTAAIIAGRAVPRRNYVACSGVGHTLRETFEMLAAVVAEDGYPIVQVRSAPWPESTYSIDKRSFVGDPQPLKEFCGWTARVSLSEGIRKTVAAFKALPAEHRA